jgi:predicted Zn-dependent protease
MRIRGLRSAFPALAAALAVAVSAAYAAALVSCQSIAGQLGAAASSLTGSSLTGKAVTSAIEAAPDVVKALEEITPEQEYYIGRAVGAQVFAQYRAYDRPALNAYLNKIGQALSLFSERPEIFRGYRFIALDSEEINAFATPSGLIMVSRGLLKLATSEDELAAVLAHEIAHVTERHGLKSIKNARFGTAIGTLAKKTGEVLVGSDMEEITGAFNDTIGDITKTMIVSGYSKASEFDADKKGVEILARAGYDPGSLARVLAAMEKKLDPKGKDFSKTHPKPKDRIKALENAVKAMKPGAGASDDAREKRYAAAMKNA